MGRTTLILILRKGRLLFLLGLIFLFLVLLTFSIVELVPVSQVNPLQGRIIAVDAGHGGIDGGSSYGSLLEKDLTLALAKILAKKLEEQGAVVILTRTTDTDLSDQISPQQEIALSKRDLESDRRLNRPTPARDRNVALGTRYPPRYRLGLRARILMATENEAEVLISLHTNKFRSAGVQGAANLYQKHSPDSKRLAECLQRYLGPLLPGRSKSPIVPDDFFILRRSPIPTVITEVGYISNTRDRKFIASAEGQEAIANAILKGLSDYFRTGLKELIVGLFGF
ncbi:MAG: N-acetylmuramoyl-L-alanine amidase family protein [Limnochordia bacterium]